MKVKELWSDLPKLLIHAGLLLIINSLACKLWYKDLYLHIFGINSFLAILFSSSYYFAKYFIDSKPEYKITVFMINTFSKILFSAMYVLVAIVESVYDELLSIIFVINYILYLIFTITRMVRL